MLTLLERGAASRREAAEAAKAEAEAARSDASAKAAEVHSRRYHAAAARQRTRRIKRLCSRGVDGTPQQQQKSYGCRRGDHRCRPRHHRRRRQRLR